MIDRMKTYALLLMMSFVGFGAGSQAIAQDMTWRVSKVSGDVSVTTSVTQVALTDGTGLKAGDNIRTGKNGRVLLTRGQETIMVSPNSALGIPRDKTDGTSTTIVQQAGSILLDVEKRNVKHFEVETPYLAAVVKGTQFRVTVNDSGANVDVLRGEVEVMDFKSGQYALVQQSQVARSLDSGPDRAVAERPGDLEPSPAGHATRPVHVAVTGCSAVAGCGPGAHHKTSSSAANRRERAASAGGIAAERRIATAEERVGVCSAVRYDQLRECVELHDDLAPQLPRHGPPAGAQRRHYIRHSACRCCRFRGVGWRLRPAALAKEEMSFAACREGRR